MIYLFQDIPEVLTPPVGSVTAILGWLVAILLAGGMWFVRTREGERREELKVWRDIASRREATLNEERAKYEETVREVTSVLERSAHVLEALREDLQEQNHEAKHWRKEVRDVHSACLVEIKRLQSSRPTAEPGS